MPSVERSVEIDAPASAAWSVLQDVRRLPELSRSTVAVDHAPARLEQAGQTFEQVVELLGRRYRSTWEVERIDPGRCLVIAGSVLPGTRYRMDEAIEAIGDRRCRVRLVMDYKLPFGPLGRLAGKLGIEARAASEAAGVLAGLKRVVEAAG